MLTYIIAQLNDKKKPERINFPSGFIFYSISIDK